ARLGDFRGEARHLIGAVSMPPGELPPGARHEIIGELDRLVTAMARYARNWAHPQATDPGDMAAPADHENAAPSAPVALIAAADRIALATRAAAEADPSTWQPVAGHPVAADLRIAAHALAAGGDLLQTHVPPPGAAPLADGSPWAQVAASPPVTSALLDELAAYARQLAPITAQLSAPAHAGLPAPAAQ